MANIVVDRGGRLVLDNVYDGLDEHTLELLRQEVMSVPKLPDETISVDEMKSYGYLFNEDDRWFVESMGVLILYYPTKSFRIWVRKYSQTSTIISLAEA